MRLDHYGVWTLANVVRRQEQVSQVLKRKRIIMLIRTYRKEKKKRAYGVVFNNEIGKNLVFIQKLVQKETKKEKSPAQSITLLFTCLQMHLPILIFLSYASLLTCLASFHPPQRKSSPGKI